MNRVGGRAVTVTAIATVVALGVSLVTTMAVLLASLAGWLMSRYLSFTPFEATGLWLLAGSVVTLVVAGLFAAFMASGAQQAQWELLERLALRDEPDEDDEDDDEVVFATPARRKPVPPRVKARRAR